MSNKGGRVSPDYLADIAPEYAVKAIDNIKNNDSEKAKQLIESIMKLTWHITL